MRHFGNFVPAKAGRVADFVELGICMAIRHDVKPVAVPSIFGDSPFVRRQYDGAPGGTNAFDLDQSSSPLLISRLVTSYPRFFS